MTQHIRFNSTQFKLITLIIMTSLLGVNSANAKVAGDARIGYFTKSSNTKPESKQYRLRFRLGYSDSITDKWQAKVRFAGRYSDDQTHQDHKFFKEIPGNDGLRTGEGTLDTVYLRYLQSENFNITVGRQQTKKELDGVAKKSLDRNTSPNTDVTWTDGVVFNAVTNSKWKHQAIVQLNYKEGATEVRRGPLDFTDDKTRYSYFYGVESKKKRGAIVQRGFDISYLPNALCVDGTSSCSNRKDYIAVVARGSAKWSISKGDRKFMLAASVGYAPNTQQNSDKSTNVPGNAYQVSANLINFLHQHSVGLVYGKVEAGWLLSPDFRNNNNLVELRYKWVLNKKQKIEARVRERTEIVKTAKNKVDNDFYVRYTIKF